MFDEIINSTAREQDFLAECSTALHPVICVHVRSGSIVVKIGGAEDDVEHALAYVSENGLVLETFPPLVLQSKLDSPVEILLR